jgi:hypothetical protein
VAAVLDDLGVEYWADFGTLLGMYREVRGSRASAAPRSPPRPCKR